RNMLVDGEWQTDVEDETDENGAFQRKETTFRDTIQPGGRFEPEPDRYHLYISRACPWAHGAVLVRKLMGLEDVISMDIVDPYRDTDGWQFTPDRDGCTKDTVNGSDYLREVYVKADPEATCRVTVPVLWDREEDTIVNNESIEIMRMLARHFTDIGNTRDLYPAEKRDTIDRIVNKIYSSINNGVYRAGFAAGQEAYEKAVEELFNALEHWDQQLADQRYLAGSTLTLADLRMFATLIRFDHVYHTHFKCNRKRITDFDNLWPYLRDLYQTDSIAETVNMAHIKEHYYRTHPGINPKGIIATGPELDL
ncbi:MAG: glutathione S-transferase family protein, partial [Candidatus Nanohaloarchaea archaeon]|nr:glutathione S-transferase family protein [Candidatus Nanohaloarchaea archaeon]